MKREEHVTFTQADLKALMLPARYRAWWVVRHQVTYNLANRRNPGRPVPWACLIRGHRWLYDVDDHAAWCDRCQMGGWLHGAWDHLIDGVSQFDPRAEEEPA